MPTNKEDAGAIRQRVGANIKRLRTAGGWSVVQCAEYIHVAESTWRSWENGHRAPDLDKLDDIAACLATTAAELVS